MNIVDSDDTETLTKQYVVWQAMQTNNWWLAVASFNRVESSIDYIFNRVDFYEQVFKVTDSFNNNKTVWEY